MRRYKSLKNARKEDEARHKIEREFGVGRDEAEAIMKRMAAGQTHFIIKTNPEKVSGPVEKEGFWKKLWNYLTQLP